MKMQKFSRRLAMMVASLAVVLLFNTGLFGFERDFFDELRPHSFFPHDVFRMDIAEKEDEYTITVEIPGVKKDNIDLSYGDNVLVISCETKDKEEDAEDVNYLHRERRLNSSTRSIRLNDAKFEKAKAKLDDGILTIKVPRAHPSENLKKIKID